MRYQLIDSHQLKRVGITTSHHASGYYEVAVFPICAITGKTNFGEEPYELERVSTSREAERLHMRYLRAARRAESQPADCDSLTDHTHIKDRGTP